MSSTGERVAYRTCPLCEATCGLELTLKGEHVLGIRGDRDDVFSHGFLCPKGYALKELHEDPDRLRTPMVKNGAGEHEPATWDQAFALVNERLTPILKADRNAVAVYIGNPNAHLLDNLLYNRVLIRALGTRNIYSASTVDQYPKQMASALMFGTSTTVAVPDLDRTEYLLLLGANPLASNGSLMTAPDVRGRLRAMRTRGGKLVVIDPRVSRTAEHADEHHFIRPGTDALLLFALVHVMFAEDLAQPGEGLEAITDGIDQVRALAEPFSPEAVAPHTGMAEDTIRRLARELATASRAAVYGRIGTTTQRFGTIASWLVDVLNVLTGNLDREGGAMFPLGAAGQANAAGPPGKGRGARFGRWASRVRGLGEIFGELPVACLAEEIQTPGEGQVRALITIGGNPVVSTPNSSRLDHALEQLELLVSLDPYLNETTRHADVILPAPSPLRRSHYDLALYLFAVRNIAHYSPPVLEPDPSIPSEWVTLLRLAGIASGAGPQCDVEAFDEMVARELIHREVGTQGSPFEGQQPDEVLELLAPRTGPERLLDLMLRAGPYELTLADLEDEPHGVDLGALKPRLPDALRTSSGRIELAPELILGDVPRLHAELQGPAPDPQDMVLIGRRQLRSNNSWMHNLPVLVKGKDRCTLHVHPDDAQRLGLTDGAQAQLRSRTGELVAPVEVTDAIMPGVVSLPHGWGHDAPGARMSVAQQHAGINSNLLADELLLDELSGNAVLNGIPVELAAVREPAPV